MSEAKSSHSTWFFIALAYACLFVYGLLDNVRGPVFPDLLKEFALSDTKGAFFFSITSFTALISSGTAAWWMPRLGEVRTLTFFSLLQAGGLVLIAYAPNFEWILVGAAILGAGMGALGLGVNVLTAHHSPPEHRRQFLSGLHCMYGVSSLISPLLVTWLYQDGFNWHTVLTLMSTGAIAIALASLSKSNVKIRDTQPAETPGVSHPYGRIIWYSCLISLYVVVEVMVGTRLVLYARRDLGYEIAVANGLLSAFFLALFVGRFLFAIVKMPFAHVTLQWVALAASFVFMCVGLLYSPWALALCGFSFSFFYPVTLARLSDELGAAAQTGLAWALTAQTIGIFVMHATLGELSDSIGLARALWTGPLCLALALGFLAFDQLRLRPKRLFP